MMHYDPFQQKAIDYINEGYSVIVAAPTGAGKTVIAEHVIRESLEKNQKVIYTAPIKALSNQKFRDFQGQFREKIGILTGDVTINPQAQTLIMTTEIFRNKLLEEKQTLKDYSWIIFDEIHFLDDEERGSVWEECLIFLPEHMNLLGLSATIPNIQELASWFESIHRRPLKTIEEKKRPVPLHLFYQCQGKIFDDLSQMVKEGYKDTRPVYPRGRRFFEDTHLKPNKPTALIRYLFEKDMLPCIYFVFSRRRTEYLAEEMRPFDFLLPEEKTRIVNLYEELCDRFDLTDEYSAKKLRPFIERGVAYHHAGMLPTLKEVVERLFTSRLLKVIFTTETFALGINMPARTVIFDELRKFYGTGHGFLKTRDFYQMAGRAGRRSIDKEGFVFCRVSPQFIPPERLHKIVYGTPEKVVSHFNASYATILNLYQRYGEKLYEIYPRSLHYFQEKKYARPVSERDRAHRRAIQELEAKVTALKTLQHIKDNQLTPKGLFASRLYGYELLLAELYTAGILEELSETALGILSVVAVYEPRKGEHRPILNAPARKLERTTQEILQGIHGIERKLGVRPLSKNCYFHLAPALEAWLHGQPFERILRATDSDEGEVVRYFRMALQILREILETPVSWELKTKIQNLIRLINRDIIDAEKQLRG